MATGIVRSFNSEMGFGLISPDLGGPPLFVQQSAIASAGVKTLKPAQRVQYDLEEGPQGLTARNIRMVKD